MIGENLKIQINIGDKITGCVNVFYTMGTLLVYKGHFCLYTGSEHLKIFNDYTVEVIGFDNVNMWVLVK